MVGGGGGEHVTGACLASGHVGKWMASNVHVANACNAAFTRHGIRHSHDHTKPSDGAD